MKKHFVLVFIFGVSISILSCSNPELDTLKAKAEEAKCKADHAMEVLENGTNTMVLAKEIGLGKELENFQKIQSDTTVSCDSIKKAWSAFSELVYQKSNK